jgi:hypothetical protein
VAPSAGVEVVPGGRDRTHSGNLRSVCEWRLDRDRECLGDNPSRFNY